MSRETVAIALVLIGHVMFVWLFIRARQPELPAEISAPRPTLFFIEPRPQVQGDIAPPSNAVHVTIPQAPAVTAPDDLTEPTTTDNAPRQIDWQSEAQRSAASVIDESQQPRARSFGPAEPAQATPRQRAFEWNPEPQRVGFAGLLPYVRVGERCVVGLGFFACAIGDLPEANGALFDGMDDPHRPQSSVPEIER